MKKYKGLTSDDKERWGSGIKMIDELAVAAQKREIIRNKMLDMITTDKVRGKK